MINWIGKDETVGNLISSDIFSFEEFSVFSYITELVVLWVDV